MLPFQKEPSQNKLLIVQVHEVLLSFEWRPHALGALSIAHCPQPNFEVPVVISMPGLSMVMFLHALLGLLPTKKDN